MSNSLNLPSNLEALQNIFQENTLRSILSALSILQAHKCSENIRLMKAKTPTGKEDRTKLKILEGALSKMRANGVI